MHSTSSIFEETVNDNFIKYIKRKLYYEQLIRIRSGRKIQTHDLLCSKTNIYLYKNLYFLFRFFFLENRDLVCFFNRFKNCIKVLFSAGFAIKFVQIWTLVVKIFKH